MSFLVYSLVLSTRVNANFWNDELYTLENFVLVPISTTVTDYHVPNNHVFFNLFCNIYLKLIGIQQLGDLLETPYLLRILPLFFSLITGFYVYLTGLKFSSKTTGVLALVFLITTIPYFNFALLIRGYGLSAMLGVICMYHLLKFLNNQQKFHLLIIGVCSFLILYTLPSNFYFILGLVIFLILYWLISFKKTSKPFSFSNPYLQTLGIISFGIIGCLSAYANIFQEVFMNSYLETIPAFSFSQLRSYVPSMAHDITSYRFLIPIIMLVGYITYFVKKRKLDQIMALFLIVSMTPFFMYYAHGDKAPLRTFTIYIPSFIFIFSIGLNYLIDSFFKPHIKRIISVALISSYCFWAFYTELNFNSRLIQNDIIHSVKKTSMFYSSYFSKHYQPLKDIKHFKTTHYDHKSPVVIIGCEPHGVRHYLDHFEIKHSPEEDLFNLLQTNDSVYVITNHFDKCPQNSLYKSIKLDPSYTYHNSVLCTHVNKSD